MSEFRILDDNYLWKTNVEITATSSNANFPVSNLTSYLRSKVHRSVAASTVLRIVIDLKAPGQVDSFCVIPPVNTGFKYSSAAVIKIRASATNYWDVTTPVNVTLSIDETYGIITHFFSSQQTYRYWCFEVSDTSNPFGYIETPKLFLSKATQLTQVPEIGFPYSMKDLSKSVSTDYGHRYVDIYPSLKGFSFNYKAISSADLETLYLIADRIGETKPVMVCLDSTATVWDKDRFVIYGYMKDFSAKQQFYSYFETGLAVEETS